MNLSYGVSTPLMFGQMPSRLRRSLVLSDEPIFQTIEHCNEASREVQLKQQMDDLQRRKRAEEATLKENNDAFHYWCDYRKPNWEIKTSEYQRKMERNRSAIDEYDREIQRLTDELKGLEGRLDEPMQQLVDEIDGIDYPELFEHVVAALDQCENIELTEDHPVYKALQARRRQLLGRQYLMGE